MTSPLIDAEALRLVQEAAWNAGFYSGQGYGHALARHDPQWDMYGPPDEPRNPYSIPQKPGF